MSTTTYNCTTADQRAEGLAHAQKAIAAQQIIVLPTDTVYGVGADAFSPQAVATLLAAKGRGRNMPPPVLMPRLQTMDGLATDVSDDARKVAEAFWPGGLTLILHAQPSLTWDLGETQGTVALRVPDDEIALDLLSLAGPMAVSSANRSGQPAAQTAADARVQLAESVEVYLEAGYRPLEGTGSLPSTIVDATGLRLRVVRQGAISLDQLRQVVPSTLGLGEEPQMWSPTAERPAGDAGADQSTADQSTADQSTADQPTVDQSTADQPTAEPTTPAAAPAGPAAADEAPRDRPTPDAVPDRTT